MGWEGASKLLLKIKENLQQFLTSILVHYISSSFCLYWQVIYVENWEWSKGVPRSIQVKRLLRNEWTKNKVSEQEGDFQSVQSHSYTDPADSKHRNRRLRGNALEIPPQCANFVGETHNGCLSKPEWKNALCISRLEGKSFYGLKEMDRK